MNQIFTGKAAIVTGASSGIGREIAKTLGREGMELWLVGRSTEQLEITANAIKELDGAVTHCVAMDLSQRGVLAELVTNVASKHPYLFSVINNAGVMYPEPILDSDPERWHEMFAINLLTPMEACRAAVSIMREHGRPAHLINISSIAAREDVYGAYGVSKSSVNHMGRTLRKELEMDDIRVTTIEPGGFTTNLVRGFSAKSLEVLQQKSAESDLDLTGDEAKKAMADPAHIANIISYVLQQPIELNFEEITIRPAVSISM